MLNGEPLFQIGPLDQGFWPDGLYTAPTDEALRYDIEITKKLGFNMTRKHVKVEPDRWYYWCDKLGLLVWQDMPSRRQQDAPSRERAVRDGTRADDRRPAEPSLDRDVGGVQRRLGPVRHRAADAARQDSSIPRRLVNNASGWTDKKVGDVLDMHDYPGPGSPKPESTRAGVLGEFGGLGLGVDGHTWSKKTWGYHGTASDRGADPRYRETARATCGS